ncbi:uncharacterized protein OCT59_018462 [Rhizophagus irregularis]|uniref:uncharacterized protein n=1 Tax=Rhizophagus irregularis TaxID=588596 RepID=UPI00331E01DB|nr:hypothetical protein OCT59_018462 [Rhizophagus irregularis]
MIISKFKKSREEVSNNLQLLTSKVSLTMDMWTSINALDVLYIPSPHDAPTIKDAVLEITNEFQVTNQLIGITSDNEAKMIAATRQIKETLELSTFQHYRLLLTS